LYTFLYRLILPFIILRLLWRSKRAPAYRQRLGERFAFFVKPKLSGGLWLHAVSLGEVIAAIPLIREFKKLYPHEIVVVTTTTPTGSRQVQTTFGEHVFHVYLPYDLPGIILRFLRKIQPRCVVIMETELWPNLLYLCHKNSIPVVLANARLSERSARNYARIKALTKEMLQHITVIATQTTTEAERYIRLGMPPNRVVVTGSIKFDISIPPDLSDRAADVRRLLGNERLIWLAASTHEGEDEQILWAHAQIRSFFPHCLLIIVPRHPERFGLVTQLCKKAGYNVTLRSESKTYDSNTDVFIGDTTGELLLFYSVADLAFVGGSLVPVGGHNLLEPAALAKPAITGPYLHNFVEISQLLLAANAIQQIQDKKQLAVAVLSYLKDAQLRYKTGQAGLQVVLNNRGALAKQMRVITEIFEGVRVC
jgi:3-deoxy-D-manno-octulosonic-acid transferase